MRKITIALIIIISVITVVIDGYLFWLFSLLSRWDKDLIPIEDLTGIYTSATLKDGQTIEYGTQIPYADNEPWCHCSVFKPDVDGIWIIDVYGKECTLVFTCTSDDRHTLYMIGNYPLEDLNYDEEIVAAADDGQVTRLYGSHFTLKQDTKITLVCALKVLGAAILIIAGLVALDRINPKRRTT